MQTAAVASDAPGRGSLLYDPKLRGIVYQVVLAIVIAFLFYKAADNAVQNLRAAKIASGFGFLNSTSGFDINQTLVPYSATSTYGRAFVVGLLNTLLVAVIGIFFATILGFLIGIARLSKNWIINKLAMSYVELIRNLPLVLQLLFWYQAVLVPLPAPRQSIAVGESLFLNNRGMFIPRAVHDDRAWIVWVAVLIAVVAAIAFRIWAKRVQEATGRQYPVVLTALLLILGLPAVVWFLLTVTGGNPITWDFPRLRGFNYQGGLQIYPEFVALVLGLVIYTAAFIAEVVRAGILAVSRGQTEAAYSLGLRPGHTLRLVVVPQAMRVIIPPLTSQYLNLTKNSSLAVIIGYPDLVQVFAGTVLNQTGQALEVIAITMAVYLIISLITSAFMNYYNSRMALVER